MIDIVLAIAGLLSALGIGGILGMLVKAKIDKPMSRAQIADLFASTAGKLVEAQNIQINELQKDAAETKSELKAENAALICEIGRLEGLIIQLKDDIALKNNEAHVMREEIRKLKRQLDDKNGKIEQLETENVQLRERVSELEWKLAKLLEKRET
jgi:chromosome segregation ATPase